MSGIAEHVLLQNPHYADALPEDGAIDDKPGRVWYENSCSACAKTFWYHRGFKPNTCPFCQARYWDKPGLERPLFIMQDEHLAGDKTALTRMYPLVHEYAQNLIKEYLRDAKISMRSSEVIEKGHDLATRIFEIILRSPEGRINLSFGALMRKIRPDILFKAAAHERVLSLNFHDDERNTDLEDIVFTIRQKDEDGMMHDTEIDKISNSTHLSLDAVDKAKVSDDLVKLVEMASEVIRENHCPRTSLLFLIGLYVRLRKNESAFLRKWYSHFGHEARNNVEKGELLIYEYLRDIQQR